MRNQPDSVRFSRTARAVQPSEHAAWLAATLGQPDSPIWIAVLDGEPIGQVRVQQSNDGWVVSVAVAPDHHGLGLGRALLLKLREEMSAYEASGTLRAEINRENVASLRMFSAAGFERVATDGDFVIMAWTWWPSRSHP